MAGEAQGGLLPVEYFHVVFTVPEQIASIAFQNKAAVYAILFRATAQTLLTIARDPKHLSADIGFFGVLHTFALARWGQNLQHHPDIHCVVFGRIPKPSLAISIRFDKSNGSSTFKPPFGGPARVWNIWAATRTG